MSLFKITWALFEAHEEHKVELHTETVDFLQLTGLFKYVLNKEKSAWHGLVSVEELGRVGLSDAESKIIKIKELIG